MLTPKIAPIAPLSPNMHGHTNMDVHEKTPRNVDKAHRRGHRRLSRVARHDNRNKTKSSNGKENVVLHQVGFECDFPRGWFGVDEWCVDARKITQHMYVRGTSKNEVHSPALCRSALARETQKAPKEKAVSSGTSKHILALQFLSGRLFEHVLVTRTVSLSPVITLQFLSRLFFLWEPPHKKKNGEA